MTATKDTHSRFTRSALLVTGPFDCEVLVFHRDGVEGRGDSPIRLHDQGCTRTHAELRAREYHHTGSGSLKRAAIHQDPAPADPAGSSILVARRTGKLSSKRLEAQPLHGPDKAAQVSKPTKLDNVHLRTFPMAPVAARTRSTPPPLFPRRAEMPRCDTGSQFIRPVSIR